MGKLILFVEEDAGFRRVFTHAMREALGDEQLDVAFVEAGSAAEARERLREGRLDAALIEITLADGNGLELVGEINDGGVGPRIPTLVLTANLETSVAVRALEAGARGALSRACYELGRKSHRNADSTVGLDPPRSTFPAFLSRF